MRILLLLNSYLKDAPNCVMLSIAQYLNNNAWDVSVCSMTSEDGYIADMLLEAGISKIYALNMSSPFSVRKACSDLSRIIDNVKPDIVHAGLVRPSVIASLLAYFKDIGILTWTQSGIHEWSECPPIPRIIMKYIIRLMSLKAERIVAVSDGLRNVLIDNEFLASRVIAIPNGVDTNRYQPDTSKCTQLRDILSIDSTSPLFGSAGNLRFVKGYDLLIKAFSCLKQNLKSAHLVIWGDGPEMENLKSMTQKQHLSECVYFLGHSNQLPDFLPQLDVYVQPSRQEAFGLATAEALASNVPVVVNDTPGLSDLSKPGVTGEKTNCFSPNDFASTMASVYQNRTVYADKCRQFICDNFSETRMLTAYEKLFRELVRGHANV